MSNTTNNTTNGTSKNKAEAEPKSNNKKMEGVLDLINANLQLVRQGILAFKHWVKFSGRNK